jgi:hypothetical protein
MLDRGRIFLKMLLNIEAEYSSQRLLNIGAEYSSQRLPEYRGRIFLPKASWI